MKSRQFNVLLRNETEKGINNIVCHFSFAYERVFFASPFETSSLCAFVWHNNVTKSFAGQEKKQQQMQKNVCMAIKPPRNVEKKKATLNWKHPGAVFCNLEDLKDLPF